MLRRYFKQPICLIHKRELNNGNKKGTGSDGAYQCGTEQACGQLACGTCCTEPCSLPDCDGNPGYCVCNDDTDCAGICRGTAEANTCRTDNSTGEYSVGC